jgi:regulator of protease activity HflC (stomatin/prohibitin superfamily)
MKEEKIGAIVLSIIVCFGIGMLVCGLFLERVPAGYCGIVYNIRSGVANETLGQGWHCVPPTKKVTLYSVGIEQSYLTATEDGDSPKDDSFSAPSSDGKGLQMELTFTYRYDAERVAETFTKFKGRDGKELLDTFIKPNVISWTKEVTAKYPVTDILGEKRAELNTVLSDYLAQKFNNYGIIIENASLINIDVDDETRKSITKKVTAQQELELANIEAQTAKIQAEKDKQVALIEAERNKETAQIQAEQAKIKAEGEAEAKKIAAQAEAEANRKIAESLTPELIEKIKAERWNGQLPKVQGEVGANIVDLTE